MDQIDDFASPLGDDAVSIWVSALLERARSSGTAEELSSEVEVVGAMVRTIAQPPLVSDLDSRRRRGISKTAARTAIAAAALLVGTSTAAATGNLPDAAQSAVSRAGSHLGVNIPDPYEDRGAVGPDSSAPATDLPTTDPSSTSTALDDASALTVPVSDDQSTSSAQSTSPNTDSAVPTSTDSPDGQAAPAGPGPDVTGPAKQGLCRAWAAHGDDSPANQNSTAMKNLQAAAAAAGQTVAEFCAEALAPDSTEVATTSTTATSDTTAEDAGDAVKNKKDDGDKDKKDDKDKEQDKDKKVKK